METERRLYQRISVGLVTNFYLESDSLGGQEFSGVIDNVSENGIKIKISNPEHRNIVEGIKVNDKISFQTADEYKLYREERIDIFSGDVLVVRAEKEGEDFVFGCMIIKATKELNEYIKNKKITMYMNTGRV